MKDLKISEIKNICKEHITKAGTVSGTFIISCHGCPFVKIHDKIRSCELNSVPAYWNIDESSSDNENNN